MHRLDTFPGEEIIQAYRKVFAGRDGAEVLSYMLYDLGFFVGVAETPEDIALKNYGTRLLHILGGGRIEADAINQFTKRLMMQPIEKETQED